jgi:hypothetical protein
MTYKARMKRPVYLALGFTSVGLGIIGVILPVMPGTIFFIMAAYFFGKSSERFESWVLNHPKYGPPVVRWQKYRAINKSGKIAALTGMSIGVCCLLLATISLIGKILGIGFILACALYVGTRPTGGEDL